MGKYHIRWLIRADLATVVAIDGESFRAGNWGDEEFTRSLRQPNCIGMVCEDADGHVIGYMVYHFFKHRLELLRIAVGQEHRNRGAGTAMIAKLKDKLSSHRRTRIACDVSEHNLGAQLFLRSRGWRCVRVDRSCGLEDEDLYRFVFSVPTEPSSGSDAESEAVR